MTRIGFILRLLRAAAVLASSLLMILAAAGWIRTRLVTDVVTRTAVWGHFPDRIVMDDVLSFNHGLGDFAIFHVRLSRGGVGANPTGFPKRVNWRHFTGPPEPLSAHWLKQVKFGIGGYGYIRDPLPPGQGVVPPGVTGICLPYWFIVSAAALAPAWWLLAFRRRRVIAGRVARGCCRRCGYDLRASPGACPECGDAATPVTAAPPAGM
jgi:hypothetical protein